MYNKNLSNNFAVIDFETATQKRNTACSVGLTIVNDNKIIETYYSLIKPPENKYDSICMSIHGITPQQTIDAPSYNDILTEMIERVKIIDSKSDFTMIAHNVSFDKSVFEKSFNKVTEYDWLCTVKLFKNLGYPINKLSYLCEKFGIELEHHNALSDSVATAQLYLEYKKLVQR